jgi:hypothetical protein
VIPLHRVYRSVKDKLDFGMFYASSKAACIKHSKIKLYRFGFGRIQYHYSYMLMDSVVLIGAVDMWRKSGKAGVSPHSWGALNGHCQSWVGAGSIRPEFIHSLPVDKFRKVDRVIYILSGLERAIFRWIIYW